MSALVDTARAILASRATARPWAVSTENPAPRPGCCVADAGATPDGPHAWVYSTAGSGTRGRPVDDAAHIALVANAADEMAAFVELTDSVLDIVSPPAAPENFDNAHADSWEQGFMAAVEHVRRRLGLSGGG